MSDEDDSGFKFLVDEMLGTLAKWLRAIGYDTEYYSGGGDSALVQQALREDRIILTRDSYLVKRKMVKKSLLVQGDDPRQEFRHVVEELGLDVKKGLFTRCLICNLELAPVEKKEVRDRVPIYTYMTQDRFYECPNCGKVYWPGTHKDSMLEFISSLIS